MKVYIVTSGCYSDYHIDAVLETSEQAEAYCALHPGDDQEIEEWDTAEYATECEKPVLKKWMGYLCSDGSIEVEEVEFEAYSFDSVFETETVTSRHFEKPYKRIRFTTAKDKTEEQAKKILLDKLAALKYEQEMGLEFK